MYEGRIGVLAGFGAAWSLLFALHALAHGSYVLAAVNAAFALLNTYNARKVW
jgi:hypothetical protein